MAHPEDPQTFSPNHPLAHATLALVAHQIPVEMHEHFAVQVVMSLQDTIRATLDGQFQPQVYGFVIDSHIAHACQPGDAAVLVISIDAATDPGKAVRERLQGHPYALLEDLLGVATIHNLQTVYGAALRASPSPYHPLALVAHLSRGMPAARPTDERVVAAMAYIAAHLHGPLRLADIATAVTLSEGRLRHLFAGETGTSLTTYILWTRMKTALRGIVRHQMSLASAAYHAGYADHAHFTRTFRRMFGVSPSVFCQHSQFISVFDEA